MMMEDQETSSEAYSLGDLRIAADKAIEAGSTTATVDARALLALCRSEVWAHGEVHRIMAATKPES